MLKSVIKCIKKVIAITLVAGIMVQMPQGIVEAQAAQKESNYIVYNEEINETFTFTTIEWGQTLVMRIPTCMEMDFSYSEGNWYEVYYANVAVNEESVTVNNNAATVTNLSYRVSGDGAFRRISVEAQPVYLYISCDEWGMEYGAYLEE